MGKRTILILFVYLILTSPVLASCSTSPQTTTTTTVTTTVPATTSKTVSITTSTTVPTTTPTTTTTGNWWNKLGTPQYGGIMTLRSNKDVAAFDPWFSEGYPSIAAAWQERLFGDDWTLDPAVFGYSIDFRPNQYVKGNLAESYEFPDPSTFVVHLRQGIHWQDIPPVNGREFTADDVSYHFHRMLGLGSGMTPSPYFVSVANYQALISVTATDKYTVVFKWKTSNPELTLETIEAIGNELDMEASEAVKQWGDVRDWHHAMGTGPFILQDYVSGSSATLIRNPNYWGYDERHPQNQLPYVDKINVLIMPDNATALSALRTGKIDMLDSVSYEQAQGVQKTNPEVLQVTIPAAGAETLDPRNDVAPFKDIRVREAMQIAIDLPTIASTYYHGTCQPTPSSLTSQYMTGWAWPYDQWPQSLKDEYAYNTTVAKQLLATAGYPNGFKTDIVCDAAGDINLMQIIKSYFAQVGIDMEIRTMDSASWTSFVKSGRKQDQLAQRTGGGSLGISSEPFRQFARFMTNGSSNYLMVSDPVFDALYNKAIAQTTIAGAQQVVIDANKYVSEQHFAISLCYPMNFTLCQPWLNGYNGQTRSIWGPATGPLMLGFYASRFWINQNLKKSMGY